MKIILIGIVQLDQSFCFNLDELLFHLHLINCNLRNIVIFLNGNKAKHK